MHGDALVVTLRQSTPSPALAKGICPAGWLAGTCSRGPATSSDSGRRVWPGAASSCPLASHQGHPGHLPLHPAP